MHYPQSAVGLNYITYPDQASPYGFTVTAHASPNTKGAWEEIIAAAPFDAEYAIVHIIGADIATTSRYLMDIGTGLPGAESVVIPEMMIDTQGTQVFHLGEADFCLPLKVAAGTRLAARSQCSVGGYKIWYTLTLIRAGGTPGISTFTNYGANPATSGGVQVDPGGVALTKGAWAEIVAATGAVAQFLMLMISGKGNSAPSNAEWSLDIGTGLNGAETVLIPNLRAAIGLNVSLREPLHPRSYSLLTYIPAGTRIAVRASCSVTDATDRLLDVVLVTGTAPAESGGSSRPAGGQMFPRGRY